MATEKKGSATPYSIGSVISKDGTAIGYRQCGKGPGVILVHGSMMSSQNFMGLSIALSDSYTVYVPDRRGRGMSGPHGDNYSIAKECEDIQALVGKTDARFIFGLSSGAIIALYSALMLPALTKVALYEPPLSAGGFSSNAWVKRYEQELVQDKLGAAFTSIIQGTADKGLMGMLPRFVLVPVMNMMIKAEAKEVKEDTVSVTSLIPTFHYDAMLVSETEGQMEKYTQLAADVLLMGGSKSIGYLGTALDALEKMLPHCRRVELPGLGHIAADNSGKPELVARLLKDFLAEA